MAEKRLASLGNRLRNNEALKEMYKEGMKDLMSKGHAVAVTSEEMDRADGKVWYLPHHPVINPNKEKPRIVFDCAAEYRGVSLNNQVFPGPGPHQQATRGAAQIQVAPGSSHGGHRGHVPPGKGEDIRSRRAAIPVVERR